MSEHESATAARGDAAAGATLGETGERVHDSGSSPQPDPVLLESRELARAALCEITAAATIGDEAGYEVHEPGVVTLFFTCLSAAYPGWRWAATVARVDAESPVTVLEVEMLPGEDALLGPEWVPWSVRLSEYRDAQDQARAAEAAALREEFTDDEFEVDDDVDVDALDDDDDASDAELPAGDTVGS